MASHLRDSLFIRWPFSMENDNRPTFIRWFHDIVSLPREIVELEGKPVGFRFRYLFSVLPFVNWFFDLFFTTKAPGYGSVKELLNIIALLNALLLGSLISLTSSVTRDELVYADNMWSNNSTSPLVKWYRSPAGANTKNPPSTVLHEDTRFSLSFFFAGLIGVVWVYADMLSKTNITKDESYWIKFFELRDRAELKHYYGFFDTFWRTDPLIALERMFDDVGDAMWDTPERRAAMSLFDEQRDERWKRQLAIEHCLFRAPNGFTPRQEIEVEVKVYSQMSVDTLGKMLLNLQNEEARVYEREMLTRDRRRERREREGNMRGHAFYLWWGFAKYSILLLIGLTTFGCIFLLITLRDFYIVKYPDVWVEKYGSSDVAHGLTNWESPTSFGAAWFQLIFVCSAVIITLSTGLGTAQKYRRENTYRNTAAGRYKRSAPLSEYQRSDGISDADFIPLPRDGAYIDTSVSTPTSPIHHIPSPAPSPPRINP